MKGLRCRRSGAYRRLKRSRRAKRTWEIDYWVYNKGGERPMGSRTAWTFFSVLFYLLS